MFWKEIQLENHSKKCDRTFKSNKDSNKTNSNRLLRNYDLIKNDKGKTYQCKRCEKRFSKKKNFNKHFSRLHSDTYDGITKPVRSKAKHYQIIKTEEGLKFQCKQCKKVYTFRASLYRHILGTHPENGYRCERCSELFATSLKLTRHSEICDGKVNEYHACDICGKVCFSKSRFILHMKSHAFEIIVLDDEKRIQCKKCEEKFERKNDFNQHFYKIHLDKWYTTYKCDICEKRFTRNWNLKKHLRFHESVKECYKCSKKFRYKVNLENHTKSCDGILKVKKIGTSKSEKIKRSHNKHYQMIENEEGVKSFQCIYCPKTYSTRDAFHTHYCRFHKEKTLKCDKCDEKFSIISILKMHQMKCDGNINQKVTRQKNYKIITSEDGEKFQCLKCPEQFLEKLEFLRHNTKHKRKKHKCDLCTKLFWNKSSLQIHTRICDGVFKPTRKFIKKSSDQEIKYIIVTSEEGKKYQCLKCSDLLLSRVAFHSHKKKHQEKFKCDKCSKKFRSKMDCENHCMMCDGIVRGRLNYVLKKQGEGKIYECKQCKKTFPYRLYFNDHFVKSHPEECFKCDKCPKLFPTSLKLKIHSGKCTRNYKIIHGTEGNLYQCNKCNRTFSNKSSFFSHFSKEHQEKKLKCEKCYKMFRYKSLLEIHVKKCDGVLITTKVKRKERSQKENYQIIEREGMNLFQCNDCEKSFTKRVNFHMHYYKHIEKTLKCNKCERKFSIPSKLKYHEKKCTAIARNANQSYKVFIDWDAKKKYQCDLCSKCFETVEDFQAHSNLNHNNVFTSVPCKKEVDLSWNENNLVHENEMIANSKTNEAESEFKTECVSESVKSEYVKQEQDPLQIDPNVFTGNTENAVEPQLIIS